MKHKPYSKLPFKVDIMHSPILSEDLYVVKDANGIDIAGLEYAGDIDFVEDACNNYQEAIELLEKTMKSTNMDKYTSNVDNIRSFLKKINDE